jgi:hypothetical protein
MVVESLLGRRSGGERKWLGWWKVVRREGKLRENKL